ncbi:ABC transporter ATP-binding protein [Microbispora sp. NPDC046973]|uniref:ABC transporter ATP-binding protein n=1 Tax=Microbispora sp. NPDC046973 TaxID=3155022 RepID=UPI0033DAB617
MNTALEAHGLGKRYRREWALRDCSLHVPAGRVAALVGPNGAGKSTLLNLAVGLLRPTEGSVRVLGRHSYGDPALLERVGFVAQEVPLYRDFTTAELMTMGAKLNRRWDATLARDRMEAFSIPLDRRVGELSGGQRAQVGLALALAKRPELLLLDEPIAGLDPLARREFMQVLMSGVAQSETTVVLSSHLLGDLERVCDYLIVLQSGRPQVCGSVHELRDEHKLLIGPPRASTDIAGVTAVIEENHFDDQSHLVVRTDGPILDPTWTVQEVSLEDLILAYLASPAPGPTVTGASQ